MTCPRCNGLLVSQWDAETRTEQVKCANCSYYPAWGKPAPEEPEKPNGKYDRSGPRYTCKCGRPKQVWRSACIKCLNRRLVYERTRLAKQKQREKRAAKKAFA